MELNIIELSNLEIIDRGRRSTIYDLGKNRVLKLYVKDFHKDKIKQEFNNNLEINKHTDIKIPNPIGILELGEQTGIVFEKIGGDSLMNRLMKNPLQYLNISKQVAKIHMNLHKIKCNLISQQEKYTIQIEESKEFDNIQKTKLLEILAKQYEPVLCHGDFHHGNIIKTIQGDIYVLDWMDAFSGSYKLDVALTAVNSMISDAPSHVPKFFYYLYELLKKVVKIDRRYIQNYGVKFDDMVEYMYLASAIHLIQCDGVGKQHRKYLNMYEKLVNSES